MSEFLDALKAAESDKPVACPIAHILDGLDDEDRQGLELVLRTGTVNNRSLTVVLREQGYDIGERAVGNHRNNNCSCRRKVDV